MTKVIRTALSFMFTGDSDVESMTISLCFGSIGSGTETGAGRSGPDGAQQLK